MNTPNPLTAAIEEEFDKAVPNVGWIPENKQRILQFICEKMQQAHALDKQEGMDEGAASAVEYIKSKVPQTEIPMVLPAGWKVRPVVEATFDEARTAHRGDSGKEV